MAKVQIKSEKITPFGGIFSIMEQFDTLLSNVIDSTLGLRSRTFGYQYSEILRSLMCVFFCGGSCIENRNSDTNVRFHQQDTLERILTKMGNNGIFINRVRMDCESCSEDIVDMVKANFNYFYIRANRCSAFATTCSFSEVGGQRESTELTTN